MKDEAIAAIVIEAADLLAERMKGASPEDVFASQATMVSHLMFKIVAQDSPREAMSMLAGQINLLDEEFPGTSRAYAIERLRGMTGMTKP